MKKSMMAVILIWTFVLFEVTADEAGKKFNPGYSVKQDSLLRLVNPFTDTHQSRWFYFRAAARPFGMVALNPDTDTGGVWRTGYLYDTQEIKCFSHIHSWQLAGIAVMPDSGSNKQSQGMDGYKSSFSHDKELAFPGYYSVYIEKSQVTAELTATERTGIHRYTFPEGKDAFIYFDTGAYLAHAKMTDAQTQIEGNKIFGYAEIGSTIRRPKSSTAFFSAELSLPVLESGTMKNGGLWIKVDTSNSQVALLTVGISFTSVENAEINRKEELKIIVENYTTNKSIAKNLIDESLPQGEEGKIFDQAICAAVAAWYEKLSRIEISGGSEKQQEKFYTDLFHSLTGRTIYSDFFGTWADNTGDQTVIRQIPLNENGLPQYNNHNFDAWWGSHWSLNILWAVVYPEIMVDFCNTMVDYYEYGGLIPRGPSGGNYTYVMIGDSAAPFFATAAAMNIGGWDMEKAYEGLKKNAFKGGIRDRAGYQHGKNIRPTVMDYYQKKGYVPSTIMTTGFHNVGASMTLEFAYQDWCLAQIALKLGKSEDADFFLNRSQNYRNIYDDKTGWMQPRFRSGLFNRAIKPYVSGPVADFCESSAAVYSYFVPHDPQGLISLMGGKQTFTQRLQSQFEKGKEFDFISGEGKKAKCWVDFSNQPGTGMVYLFSHAGREDLTAKWKFLVKDAAYGETSPYGGYNGDEDQGQMGAVGVLMAAGIFSFNGLAEVSPKIELSLPIFDQVKVRLNQKFFSGKELVIKRSNFTGESFKYKQLLYNNEELGDFRLDFEKWKNGGVVEFLF
ncbi:MAG: GH92 family glycosyl hydrolase [Spirochaetales bacterium]|nr:GH92 family glycosyl hydrolase [Spirochaetales bacterium]